MKSDIHPNYFSSTQVTCACGAVFTTGSTKENLQTELCSRCHPIYTGDTNLKFISDDSITKYEAKIEKFKELSQQPRKSKKEKNAERKAKKADKTQATSESK